MISDALPKWTVVIVIFVGGVHSQMPMMPMGFGYGGPMMMPPPPPPIAMPMPMPVPIPIPVPYPESTSKTTTTEAQTKDEENGDNRIPIAIPIPMPHIVQIGIPGFMPPNCMPNDKNNGKNGNGNKKNNCPPCPPCSCNPCTPSFFSYCSPCHLECRCKNGKENPTPREPNAPKPFPGPVFPMPIPLPAPGPVVIVPFPSQFNPNRRHKDSDCESHPASNSCSEESKADSCDSDQDTRKRKRKRGRGGNRKRKNYDIYRRNFGFLRNRSEKRDGLVKPVLTYRSRNGDIKMERRLSNDEANALLDGRGPYGNKEPYYRAKKTYTNVHLTAGEDSHNRQRLVLRSEPGEIRSHRHRQQLVADKSQQYLGNGKKELMFRTPDNKTISNLTVSFQITK